MNPCDIPQRSGLPEDAIPALLAALDETRLAGFDAGIVQNIKLRIGNYHKHILAASDDYCFLSHLINEQGV